MSDNLSIDLFSIYVAVYIYLIRLDTPQMTNEELVIRELLINWHWVKLEKNETFNLSIKEYYNKLLHE